MSNCQDELNDPNSMGLRRLITEFLWPPSSSINRPGYHIVSKYSSRRIKRAQTRWGCRRLITEFLWPPSSSIIRPCSINRPWLPYISKYIVKTNSNEPKLDGLRRLITEFLWPPSSSIIRPWLPYSIKVLVKTNSNEPKLDGVASFNYGVPMATFQLHHQTLVTISKYSSRRIKEPKLDGLRRLITEFLAALQLHQQISSTYK
ncbi:hypothetical protein EVAR_59106_1 [Eumeta japonica]|uniref:Uncharacterized protein n=1 Tax=Eumeta variegata TaxID=151549 RepID=A0A4C1YVB8_EUMVA|nr:hypothetical protein EVAR_59106_1 [Eumeta japonica]